MKIGRGNEEREGKFVNMKRRRERREGFFFGEEKDFY